MFCLKCGKETTENAVFCAGCGARLTSMPPAKKGIFGTIAGVVEIVAGVFTGITAIICLVAMLIAEDMPGWFLFFPVLTLVLLCMLAVIGGVCALRRKYWIVALVGSIAVIWPTVVLGIAALVLNIVARDEFERKPTPR